MWRHGTTWFALVTWPAHRDAARTERWLLVVVEQASLIRNPAVARARWRWWWPMGSWVGVALVAAVATLTAVANNLLMGQMNLPLMAK